MKDESTTINSFNRCQLSEALNQLKGQTNQLLQTELKSFTSNLIIPVRPARKPVKLC